MRQRLVAKESQCMTLKEETGWERGGAEAAEAEGGGRWCPQDQGQKRSEECGCCTQCVAAVTAAVVFLVPAVPAASVKPRYRLDISSYRSLLTPTAKAGIRLNTIGCQIVK